MLPQPEPPGPTPVLPGVDPLTGSTSCASLAAAPSLEALVGGAGSLNVVCARLRSAPSVASFLADLQDVLERLAFSNGAGPGPGSGAGGGRPAPHGALSAASCAAASASLRLMQLLLRDLDALGWGCLEELEQDAARLTLLHVDAAGRQHRLRLSLPPAYPAAPPAAATDLPVPFTFGWSPPAPATAAGWSAPDTATRCTGGLHDGGGGTGGGAAGGWGGGGYGERADADWRRGAAAAAQRQQRPHRGAGGGGGACSSVADVYWAFTESVSRLQPLWSRLDELDATVRVLDPPPGSSCGGRHLFAPSRRLALGGPASLQLRLDPTDPAGPPAHGGVAFLGPPEAVAALREGFFGRLHLWSRERSIADNLQELLGQALPQPAGSRDQGAGAAGGGGSSGLGGASTASGAADAGAEGEGEDDALLSECAICRCYLLEVEAEDGDEGEEEGHKEEGGAGGAGGGGRGLVPEVVCPTPACGLPFHAPCLAEWLRSLPDTRASFSSLFGRCPFCSSPITVRA
ncbi:hypothetical protein GPECTOR_64g119 [Gonium pectorale]|uniref:RING-type domain-containing protein n=1 Tax=Gonium pectorale TaxID=33097 RepID=A0A150G513_GONPE|nr:hypothetical protein GPECTOR_64g119 [Gonium pectorale]|eukprot:KXZ44625.1 hypothetical protein GPECTOR_64g119 [Gonium pectorale]